MKKESAYAKAGVDIEKATQAVDLMKSYIRLTYTQNVLSHVGTFGGLLDVTILKKYQQPVFVFSIDGVGTKTMIAEEMDQWTVGQDIVNHGVNDILVQGAQPLAFLDYVAASRLKPEIMAKIVENMAIACREIGIPLISGETAEMPGIYQEGQYDVVGAIVGIVEKDKIIDGSKIGKGNVLIGLPSNGIHTNGLSLARKAFFKTSGLQVKTGFSQGESHPYVIGKELLRVHKCYLNQVSPLLNIVNGIAHITGGGLIDNIARILPEGLCAKISQKWEVPPIFRDIQMIEKVSDEEMRRVFNMGIGMVLIVPFEETKLVRGLLRDAGELEHILIGTIDKAESEEKVVFTY